MSSEFNEALCQSLCTILVYLPKSPPQEVIRVGAACLEEGVEPQTPQRWVEMIYSPPLGERDAK